MSVLNVWVVWMVMMFDVLCVSVEVKLGVVVCVL